MEFIANYWYYPIMILIIVTGIILTIELKGIQFRKLGKALKLMVSSNQSGSGEVSSFAALCISLSATIGTGNIVGVATALTIGGPGALFWMTLVSILGLATKYAEGFLAIKFRKINEKKEVIGGPFAYIEYGMGKKYIPLAKTFALLGALAAVLGIGTMAQSNGITGAFADVFKLNQEVFSIGNHSISLVTVIIGFAVTILVTLVLVGGIKRISKVCEFVVPFMAIIYVGVCLLILIMNITKIPQAFQDIVLMAFNKKSVLGGVLSYSIAKSLTSGVQKGIFANEAGLGSTPIALSTAKSQSPADTALVSMAGMFITIIICMMTGLAVVITNSYGIGLEGIHVTNHAFIEGLPFHPMFSSILLLLCITFFAFTTIIGWQLYGKKCIDYLTNGNAVAAKIYLCIYILMVFLGSFLKVNVIWTISDIFNSLMAVPNLIALLALKKVIK